MAPLFLVGLECQTAVLVGKEARGCTQQRSFVFGVPFKEIMFCITLKRNVARSMNDEKHNFADKVYKWKKTMTSK